MSVIKECFTSRFPNGKLVVADFSQLEVVVQAFITSDPQLYKDIIGGVDLHCVSASWIWGVPYNSVKYGVDTKDPLWIQRRKEAKQPRFELQYGASYKTIARNNNWTENKAREYIDAYYKRYPKVKLWQDGLLTLIKNIRVSSPNGRRTKKGFPSGESKYFTSYGRTFLFYEYDNDYKGVGSTSFSRNEVINYPIQGFAGGDLALAVLGELYLHVKDNPKILLVGTVHDSYILDCAEGEVDKAAELLYHVMTNAPLILKERLNIDFDLPIKAEVSAGNNLSNQESINVNN